MYWSSVNKFMWIRFTVNMEVAHWIEIIINTYCLINVWCSCIRPSSTLNCKVYTCVVGGGGLAFFWGDMWHEMTYNVTWHNMTFNMTCNKTCDMTYDMTWQDTWYDMTWHDKIHDMTYDMTWQDTWYDIWHDMTRYMIWHDMTWHDTTYWKITAFLGAYRFCHYQWHH